MNIDVFVKLNYKTIGEFKSLIVDRQHKDYDNNKYMICTGKYDKDGWTFIFKANSLKEAEEFINKNSIKKRNIISKRRILEDNISLINNDKVHIPAWI